MFGYQELKIQNNVRGAKDMTGKKKNSIHPNTSRQKARAFMFKLYPFAVRDKTVVHHKDENPFNNNFNNLEILPIGQHIKYHQKGKRKGMRQTTLRSIEKLFSDYNWNK